MAVTASIDANEWLRKLIEETAILSQSLTPRPRSGWGSRPITTCGTR
jgi:hypothetical protein